MTIPPESIEIGKCYLGKGPKALWIRRVLQLLPDGRLRYEERTSRTAWRQRTQFQDVFASMVEREVPCDWLPETSEAGT